MRYRNGREAKEGDRVVGATWKDADGKPQNIISGTIHSLQAGSASCNGQIAYVVPGGTQHSCVTVGDFWHVADALAAAEATLPQKK